MYECSVEGYIMVCPIRRNPTNYFDCMKCFGSQGSWEVDSCGV